MMVLQVTQLTSNLEALCRRYSDTRTLLMNIQNLRNESQINLLFSVCSFLLSGAPQFGGHHAAMRGMMHQPHINQQYSGFDDKAVRRGFIKKVYGILMCQLLLTAAIICVFMFVPEVKGCVTSIFLFRLQVK